jgi:hypothetical protein
MQSLGIFFKVIVVTLFSIYNGSLFGQGEISDSKLKRYIDTYSFIIGQEFSLNFISNVNPELNDYVKKINAVVLLHFANNDLQLPEEGGDFRILHYQPSTPRRSTESKL